MNTTKKNLLFVFLAILIFGCKETTNTGEIEPQTDKKDTALSLLTETRTTQYFSDETVSVEDISIILDAGRNAMSGRNMQSWHFGTILNPNIIKEIASKMPQRMPPPPAPKDTTNKAGSMLPPTSTAYPKAGFADAPAAIALACTPNNTFDLGLATQNMVIAANAIGYGAKIVMGGAAQLNEPENRIMLEIPEDMNVVAILLIGKPDSSIDMTADGVTGASVRKSLEEVSTIVQ